MRINDEGKLVYEITEVPLELLYDDLSYTILSSREPKKILPIVKECLGGELRFLFNHNLINNLVIDLSDEIKDYLQYKLFNALLEAVSLKFIKYIKERSKEDPIDLSEFYEKVISQDAETKIWYYTPTTENDPEDLHHESKKLAEMFLWDIVYPAVRYIMDKYCEKQYTVSVSEVVNKHYKNFITSEDVNNMTDEELMEKIKDTPFEEEHKTVINRIFVGYVKKENI